MRHVHHRGLRAKLGASALAITTLFAGAACGAGTSTAGERAARTGTTVQQGPSTQADVAKELRSLETSYQGRIGAFAIDTATGRSVGYRTHERFPSNSSFKAILCGAILHRSRTADPGLLDRTLRWSADDVVSHSPVTGLKENIENGLTSARLCHATITTSDNTAANVLLKQIGGPPGLTRFYRSLGDPVGRLDRWETDLNIWAPGEKRDTIMPAFMAADLRKLTLGPALVAQDSKRLNDWLRANTTGDKRIRAGLPEGWTVGDKTGTGGVYGAASDIAIAWPPSGAPLIIAVYTNRNTEDGAVDDTVFAKTTTVLARGLGKIS
ncbi:class A beta-lactamase [Actinomadura rugatobispora]|uniref:Class A beta-lactamase n=1 Tax=Actinomadura rugatobispora TaxID=1994 RepID=A0ABW1AFI4_9ACTN|nr:PEN family class A beta-lactamase, Bpc-type [Actinomadura rugatobispora]